MKLNDQVQVVFDLNLDVNRTVAWYRKYCDQQKSSAKRLLPSELTFQDYLTKAVEAGLTDPSQIGPKRGEYVLGRVGDIGNYTTENCRFITSEQNKQECLDNGGYARSATSRTGRTKENDAGRAAQADKLRGRTKETHPSVARVADKKSKDATLIDPSGVEHHAHNMKEFCNRHGLHPGKISEVCNGKRNHHKGWRGSYQE